MFARECREFYWNRRRRTSARQEDCIIEESSEHESEDEKTGGKDEEEEGGRYRAESTKIPNIETAMLPSKDRSMGGKRNLLPI